MIRHAATFFGTFVLGALVALVARAAWFSPYEHQPAATPAPSAGEYAPMVTNELAPARAAAADPHAAHAAPGKPVNDVCAICGMDVDPSLPTAEYKGKTIGFGCRMCPPKFKANPDKYGPAYLRNEVLEN